MSARTTVDLKLLRLQSLVPLTGTLGGPPPELDFIQSVERDQADAEGIVEVVGVVGQAVGRIDNLGFQQRLAGFQKFLHLGGVLALAVHRLCLAAPPRKGSGPENRRNGIPASPQSASRAGCARSRRESLMTRSGPPRRHGRTADGPGRAQGNGLRQIFIETELPGRWFG